MTGQNNFSNPCIKTVPRAYSESLAHVLLGGIGKHTTAPPTTKSIITLCPKLNGRKTITYQKVILCGKESERRLGSQFKPIVKETIHFLGNTYTRYVEHPIKKRRSVYFNNTTNGDELHRDVYKYYNHEIEQDYFIHHIDFNSNNNRADNLQPLSFHEHMKKHSEEYRRLRNL